MAKLYIKKHKLVAGGTRYEAGAVVELPNETAYKLAKESPEEFEVLVEPVSETRKEETLSESKEEVKVEATEPEKELSELKLADLRKLCDEKGISYKARDTKDKLIQAIKALDEETNGTDELLGGLPPVDLGEFVK